MVGTKPVGSERHPLRVLTRRLSVAAVAILGLGIAASASAVEAPTIEALQQLSIEELANIQISSVTKVAEPLSDAPAAIFVITHDDIMRSGLTKIPDILRLAPNLEVAQLDATSYAITARGFNAGNNASMSDKMLVLIDGRSVYTPLFAGVYWDMQAVLPEDIERIEVISGPGATLWGANAVNGVINIITRKSDDTQGGVADIGAGNLQRSASLQYGGKVGDDLSYRVHMEGSNYSPFKTTQGTDAEDGWSTEQGGFRLDWTPDGDHVMAEADAFTNRLGAGNALGRDFVTNWQHQFDNGSMLQLNAYYDDARRSADNGLGFVVDTYNLDLQHDFAVGSWNSIANTPSLAFIPSGRTLNLANVFVQDTASFTDRLKLTIGLKLEDEPFGGVQPMPSARLSWKATDGVLLWSAVSRAVRAPTPIDDDLVEAVGGVTILGGSPSFMPEELVAYEFGTRVQPIPEVSFSLSSFYNDYSNLRSIEVTPVTVLPLHWGNLMDGHIVGVEFWGNYQPTSWWRLSAGLNVQHEHLGFEAGSSGLAGVAFAADDPNFQASARSSIRLTDELSWNAYLRHIGEIHDIGVPSYTELNSGISWMVTKSLELSVSGFNLLHAKHAEFIEIGESDEVPRSFFVETRWRF